MSAPIVTRPDRSFSITFRALLPIGYSNLPARRFTPDNFFFQKMFRMTRPASTDNQREGPGVGTGATFGRSILESDLIWRQVSNSM